MDCRRSRGTVRVVVEKPILATDGLTGLDLDFALQIEHAGTLRFYAGIRNRQTISPPRREA
jgi:hypothetical protein